MDAHKRWATCVAGAVCCALMGAVSAPGAAEAVVGSKWAVVTATGSLVRGNGVRSVARTGTGTYEVVFTQDMRSCAYEATSGDPGAGVVAAPAVATVASLPSKVNGVHVQTFSQTNGQLLDEPFHLSTYCGATPAYAVIDADGTTARGSHVTSSLALGAGSYVVTFDHNVSRCAFTATLGTTSAGSDSGPNEISVAGAPADHRGVLVQILDRAGAKVSVPFHLAVDCGARRLVAVIDSDGSTARGAHAVSSAHGAGPGLYEVVFDRDVTTCAYNATVGATNNRGAIDDPVTITTASRVGKPNGVFVSIRFVSAAPADEPFHLRVLC